MNGTLICADVGALFVGVALERLGHDVGTLMRTYAHVIRPTANASERSWRRRSLDLLRTG